jgi:hypothetical protein
LKEVEEKYVSLINKYKKFENFIYDDWFRNSNESAERFINDVLIVNLNNSKKINLKFFEQV